MYITRVMRIFLLHVTVCLDLTICRYVDAPMLLQLQRHCVHTYIHTCMYVCTYVELLELKSPDIVSVCGKKAKMKKTD
jgi:hypothetical protein